MKAITPIQLAVLRFIAKHVKEHGWPPTLREMAGEFEWTSTNAGADHLRRLVAKEYLVVTPGISRGIKLTDKGNQLVQALEI